MYQEAIANYSIAIRHNPKNFDIYMNRGDMRMKIGDYYGAISDYSIYQQNFATSPNVYLKRGLANLKANFKGKAYNDLKMADALGSESAMRIISEQNLSSWANSSSSNIYQRDNYDSLNESRSFYQRNSYRSYQESNYNFQRNYHESIRYQNYSYLPRYFSLSELYKNAIKDSPRNNEIPNSNTNEINTTALKDKYVVITGTIPGMKRKEVERSKIEVQNGERNSAPKKTPQMGCFGHPKRAPRDPLKGLKGPIYNRKIAQKLKFICLLNLQM